jgi:hypothetical protein
MPNCKYHNKVCPLLFPIGDYGKEIFLKSSIEKEKCKSKNKGNGIWVKRRIYYCVSFYDDVIPYREGNVEFETATLSREEPWKECQFVSIELDIIKDMVCQKYCKQLKEIEQFQVNKIEIIEKR